MEPPQASGPTPDGPVIARSLAELEVVVRRDLAYTAYPTPPWIPARLHNGQSLLDVAIVGAGQGGNREKERQKLRAPLHRAAYQRFLLPCTAAPSASWAHRMRLLSSPSGRSWRR